jgi:hypothetical protein
MLPIGVIIIQYDPLAGGGHVVGIVVTEVDVTAGVFVKVVVGGQV